jgi:hypothetical protein
VHELIVVAGGKHDHPHIGMRRDDAACYIDPTSVWQPHVDEHDVRLQLGDQGQCSFAVPGLPDNRDVT